MDLKTLLSFGYRQFFSKPHKPDAAPLIVVMIPLVGKARAKDWEAVCRVLEDTLDALRAQSYQNYEVLLCSQDRPDNFPQQEGYHFISAPPHHAAETVSDQGLKVRLMSAYAGETFDRFSYVLHLDADDLPHPDLFRYVVENNNGRGYLIEQGYMLDAPSGRLGLFGRDIGGTQDLCEHCGSCALFAVDWGKQAFPASYMRLIGNGHRKYAERAARLGFPLDPIPFPSMLYVVNHGDNMQIRKGNDKLLYIEDNDITDPARLSAIREDFGLSEPAAASL